MLEDNQGRLYSNMAATKLGYNYRAMKLTISAHHFETRWASSTTTATILSKIAGVSRAALHLGKARASGAQNSRLSVYRFVSPAMRGLAKSLQDVMSEVFTFLLLKSSTWSTIRETRGDTTSIALVLEVPALPSLKSITKGMAW